MKALVTGANGFVGKYLIEHLSKSGFDAYGFDLSFKEESSNFFNVNITSYEEVNSRMADILPDYVFHLAAQSSVRASWEKPELTRQINVGGTKNLFDSFVENKIKPRILVVSSAEIYGIPAKLPITEQHRLNPQSPYAESKLEQEQLALDYFKAEKIPAIISRSFPHTGPGQQPSFVCSEFAKKIAGIEKGAEPIISVGNLDAKRDFSDVRDIVRAYLLALQKGAPGEVYNICSGRAYSIKGLLDMLLSFSDTKIKLVTDPEKFRKNDIPILLGDCSKFSMQTGWKPVIPIEKTLKDLMDYWRSS